MKCTPLGSGSGGERTSSGRAVPVLISVFIVGTDSLELLAAGGKAALVAPTITAKPASLMSSTSATSAFSGAPRATLQSQRGTAAFATCASFKSFKSFTEPLAQSRHAFQINSQGSRSFLVRPVDAAASSTFSTMSSWSVDNLASSAPVMTQKQSEPPADVTNICVGTEARVGASLRHWLENGAWTACSLPHIHDVATSKNGPNQFGVRSLDGAGNLSGATSHRYKYQKGLTTSSLTTSNLPLQITTRANELSLGAWNPIEVTASNPNRVVIDVSALHATIRAISTPTGYLSSGNVELKQLNVSSLRLVAVPPNGSIVLPAETAPAPQIPVMDLSTVNKNKCKTGNFTLRCAGPATN